MAKKETKSKNPAPVISTLVVRAPQRKTSDVAYWRNALKSADGGYIMRLYDMYEDLLIDGVLADAHSKRIEAVTNAELIFQGARGENVPEIAALMETLDWEVMIKEFVQPVFWGRAGVEFDFTGGFRATPIPKKHISLETGKILIEAGGDTGVSYADDDHLLVLGNTRDWGLFLRTAPYIIWKRGGFGDWAEWLEIFGMPQRVGKYNTYDPQSRILLEEALEKSGSAPWCVIPDGSNVETVNNTGSGSSGTSYADFRNACNEELLIAMLGQTLTTLQGERGARSLGEVHKKVEEGKNKADMRYVEKVLNTYLVPRLESRGYPVKGGRFVFPEATESISVADIVSLSDILDIPVKFLYDKYGIPVPKDGERIAAQRMQQDTKEPDNAKSAPAGKKDAEPEPEPEPEPAPAVKAKGKEVKNSDRGFFSLLTDFFADAPARWNGAIRRFTGRLTSSTGTVTLADDYSIDIDDLVRKAVREIYGSRGEELINAHLFEITNTALQQAVDTSLSGIAESDPDFVQQFKENTAVFAAFKNHQQTKEIAALLYDENGKLKPFYKFRREALQISKDYNVTWLQTEYNTAVRAARMAANMKKYKKTSHLYPNLEYIETSSAHPRASHLSYVGTILPIEHPWWNDHLPPSDWNCACSVRPTDKPATPVPDGEYTPPVFRNNPERTAEFLNIKETAYCKHTAESLEGEIKEVAGDLLRTSQCEVLETYEGKNGGYLKVVKQNKAERDKNLITYKIMADNGGRYSLLEELPGDKVKNPDAFNFKTLRNSEAKHPITPNGQKAIQRSIEQAAKQADEIVIRLNQEYPSYSLYRGLYAALQNTHTQNVKVIFILRPGRKPLELDADKLRSRFFGK